MLWNNWTTTTQPSCSNYWSPRTLNAHALQQEKPQQWEAHAWQLQSHPHSLQVEKKPTQQTRPSIRKRNKRKQKKECNSYIYPHLYVTESLCCTPEHCKSTIYFNKKYEEKKKATPSTTVPERIKYGRINLNQKIKYLHTENYKTLLKVIKEALNESYLTSIGRLNIVINIT